MNYGRSVVKTMERFSLDFLSEFGCRQFTQDGAWLGGLLVSMIEVSKIANSKRRIAPEYLFKDERISVKRVMNVIGFYLEGFFLLCLAFLASPVSAAQWASQSDGPRQVQQEGEQHPKDANGQREDKKVLTMRINLYGRVVPAACRIRERVAERQSLLVPFIYGQKQLYQRIDNYLIEFSGCQIKEHGVRTVDVELVNQWDPERPLWRLEPDFRLIACKGSAVDKLTVNIAADVSTQATLELEQLDRQSNLYWLRVFYPEGFTQPSEQGYDSVNVELSYR